MVQPVLEILLVWTVITQWKENSISERSEGGITLERILRSGPPSSLYLNN